MAHAENGVCQSPAAKTPRDLPVLVPGTPLGSVSSCSPAMQRPACMSPIARGDRSVDNPSPASNRCSSRAGISSPSASTRPSRRLRATPRTPPARAAVPSPESPSWPVRSNSTPSRASVSTVQFEDPSEIPPHLLPDPFSPLVNPRFINRRSSSCL
eukprot:TRINITY_DN4511_c0_g1_i1.p1 TRINITY_DN4511_c0_g1~~TRINITY_DN4511_c0_g1_i1.p1  ORF type:complete len:172 (+),score=20.22 TRINITY_DN4511_c0_g1_i1:49-516(+)